MPAGRQRIYFSCKVCGKVPLVRGGSFCKEHLQEYNRKATRKKRGWSEAQLNLPNLAPRFLSHCRECNKPRNAEFRGGLCNGCYRTRYRIAGRRKRGWSEDRLLDPPRPVRTNCGDCGCKVRDKKAWGKIRCAACRKIYDCNRARTLRAKKKARQEQEARNAKQTPL